MAPSKDQVDSIRDAFTHVGVQPDRLALQDGYILQMIETFRMRLNRKSSADPLGSEQQMIADVTEVWGVTLAEFLEYAPDALKGVDRREALVEMMQICSKYMLYKSRLRSKYSKVTENRVHLKAIVDAIAVAKPELSIDVADDGGGAGAMEVEDSSGAIATSDEADTAAIEDAPSDDSGTQVI